MSDAVHNLLQIAQVLKSNGTDGELVMSFREIGPEEIGQNEPVFIIFDGLPVPFFIESFSRRGTKKAIVRLTGICSQEDAEEIAGKPVFMQSCGNDELDISKDGFAALVGWTLSAPVNEGDGSEILEDEIEVEEVGTITDYLDIPNNPCIEAETEKGMVMIPFHEDLIISVDPENHEIIMDIPSGLI
ncbi:MAG: hypothetical protein K2H95_06385 [Bacteroidales bacterium]|nr:hypothetical protein [Bacteroidales bacterium]MDE6146624.1 hypothetical protein [Bacteroidales bacterium]